MATRIMARGLQAVAIAALLAACFDPEIGRCALECAGDGSCPPGTTCLADGFCHQGAGEALCAAPPDAAAPTDAADPTDAAAPPDAADPTDAADPADAGSSPPSP
jgi:hypothetical protein